jgi:ribonuclease Z
MTNLMTSGRQLAGLLFLVSCSVAAYEPEWEPRDLSTSEVTKILMLGTGNPLPYPHRNGPSIAVVVNEQPYIFDAGEGIWHGMGREMPYFGASRIKGFALRQNQATRLFITHLHSDHTLGVPALLLAPWALGRTEPVQVYGPPGTAELVEHVLIAYRRDIDYRVYSPTEKNDSGWRAEPHEISEEGLVYEDGNVRVHAFKACHGLWPFPIAYRIEAPDKVIAISGDTTPCPGVTKAAQGADILLHEVVSIDSTRNDVWPGGQAIPVPQQMKMMHTTTKELAELAQEIQPELLVTYHEQNFSDNPNAIVEEIASFGFKGKVISARDGDIY